MQVALKPNHVNAGQISLTRHQPVVFQAEHIGRIWVEPA